MLDVVTDDAAMVDRSERGKLALTGDEAAAALNGIVSNEVNANADVRTPPNGAPKMAMVRPPAKQPTSIRG